MLEGSRAQSGRILPLFSWKRHGAGPDRCMGCSWGLYGSPKPTGSGLVCLAAEKFAFFAVSETLNRVHVAPGAGNVTLGSGCLFFDPGALYGHFTPDFWF